MSEPKIVFYDLETLPNLPEVMKEIPGLGDYPGKTLKASINSIICFGHHILGEKKTKCLSAWDFPAWRKDVNDDHALVKAARDVLIDADCVVTFNGKRFDEKVLNTRLMLNGLDPLPKIKHVDVYQVVKSNLSLIRNNLKTCARLLTNKKKLDTGGWELWVKVLNRNQKAMRDMSSYCMGDVDALKALFNRVRPFITTLPNQNLYVTGLKPLCPSCGSSRLISNGWRPTASSVYRRYSCKDCGAWCRTDSRDKNPRAV